MFTDIIPGWLAKVESLSLFDQTKPYNYRDCVGVEIGSLHGKSAAIIAQAIPLGTLYCIDLWDERDLYNGKFSDLIVEQHNLPRRGMRNSLELFREYTKNYNNIQAIKGTSPYCVKNWHQSVDFVFLDAGHTNPNDRDNIDFWLLKIKPGGLLIGHDLKPQLPDVQKNVKYLSNLLNQDPVIVKTLWSFKIG